MQEEDFDFPAKSKEKNSKVLRTFEKTTKRTAKWVPEPRLATRKLHSGPPGQTRKTSIEIASKAPDIISYPKCQETRVSRKETQGARGGETGDVAGEAMEALCVHCEKNSDALPVHCAKREDCTIKYEKPYLFPQMPGYMDICNNS